MNTCSRNDFPEPVWPASMACAHGFPSWFSPSHILKRSPTGVATIFSAESAKRFVDWINRKDTREMILKATFRRPTRKDLDLSKLPGRMPALTSVKLLPYQEEAWTAKRREALDKIKELIQETR
jgi:hypothetical protein